MVVSGSRWIRRDLTRRQGMGEVFSKTLCGEKTKLHETYNYLGQYDPSGLTFRVLLYRFG